MEQRVFAVPARVQAIELGRLKSVSLAMMASIPTVGPGDETTGEYVSPMLRPPRVSVECHGQTHPGKVRQNNEDHYLIARMSRTFRSLDTNMPEGGLPAPVDDVAYGMVVADGMGGMAAGEKASQLAIRTGEVRVFDLAMPGSLETVHATAPVCSCAPGIRMAPVASSIVTRTTCCPPSACSAKA